MYTAAFVHSLHYKTLSDTMLLESKGIIYSTPRFKNKSAFLSRISILLLLCIVSFKRSLKYQNNELTFNFHFGSNKDEHYLMQPSPTPPYHPPPVC